MTSGRSDALTILVPTYNRYPRLLRLLRYARSAGVPYVIRVLDSSSDRLDSPELETCLKSDGVVHVRYDPTIRPQARVADGMKSVTSPYVVLWADDDFLVPRALELGVRFLEQHPDYAIVHGQSAIFEVVSRRGGRDIDCMRYHQRALKATTGAARIRDYLRHLTVFNYSIHRSEWLRRNSTLCRDHDLAHSWWPELVVGCLSAIQGNAEHLDCLYLVKETHAGMESVNELDAFDWVTGASFGHTYTTFRDCLARELARQDGMSFAEAQAVIKDAFWSYLAHALMTKWRARERHRQRRPLAELRAVAARVPGLRAAWRTVTANVPGAAGEMSLPSLLRPSSRYHTDFMPIYQAITTG